MLLAPSLVCLLAPLVHAHAGLEPRAHAAAAATATAVAAASSQDARQAEPKQGSQEDARAERQRQRREAAQKQAEGDKQLKEAADAKKSSAKAPARAALEAAPARCVEILLSRQESMTEGAPKAEWPYEGVYRVAPYEGEARAAQIPLGYRIGGTSIASTALIRAHGGKPTEEVQAALERALDFVLDKLGHPLMQPEGCKGYDVRGWGHAYALEFLLLLEQHSLVQGERKEKVASTIAWLIGALDTMEHAQSGGWNYARTDAPQGASPFMTAPTLQILYQAKAQGHAVPDELVSRALQTLEDSRGESGAIQYATNAGSKSGKSAEEIPAAVARMAVVETTLHLAGRGSPERIRVAVDAFFAHWEWLEVRRRQGGTHIPPYSIAPYYFFYGHRYVAQAIEFLPEKDRAELRSRLQSLLWVVREESGGWNDRVFDRSENFGTAMTLLALLEPKSARPTGWANGATNGATKGVTNDAKKAKTGTKPDAQGEPTGGAGSGS